MQDGARRTIAVKKVSRTQAPDHPVVEIVLEDGRSLSASPGHPLTDGRTIGGIVIGDALDGSGVVSIAVLPSGEPYTYDLLAGEGYWANGILVASSLAR